MLIRRARQAVVTAIFFLAPSFFRHLVGHENQADARKVFHSLIRKLGGKNQCRPKAAKHCKSWQTWYDKLDNPPASPNGCGSIDLPVKLAKHGNFTPCCNIHDECYATCNKTKATCDDSFHACMIKHCEENYTGKQNGKRFLKKCLDEASLYYSGTYGLGCGAYKKSQRNHWTCRRKSEVEQEIMKRLKIKEGQQEAEDKKIIDSIGLDQKAEKEGIEAEEQDYEEDGIELEYYKEDEGIELEYYKEDEEDIIEEEVENDQGVKGIMNLTTGEEETGLVKE